MFAVRYENFSLANQTIAADPDNGLLVQQSSLMAVGRTYLDRATTGPRSRGSRHKRQGPADYEYDWQILHRFNNIWARSVSPHRALTSSAFYSHISDPRFL